MKTNEDSMLLKFNDAYEILKSTSCCKDRKEWPYTVGIVMVCTKVISDVELYFVLSTVEIINGLTDA